MDEQQTAILLLDAEPTSGDDPGPATAEGSGERRDFAAPLGAATGGRLRFVPGASRVTIAGDRALPDLWRARFDGPVPNVRVEGGTVTIEDRRLSPLEWTRFALRDGGRHAARITLNGAIPWRIEVRGGVSRLTADLSELRLEALEVGGGASRVVLTLPRPRGTVPVRIGGGASAVVVHRPAGVAARLRTGGGASHLAFDGRRVGAVGRESRWQTPDYGGAAARYDVAIAGGASDVTIGTR